jgi:hypothetical protein
MAKGNKKSAKEASNTFHNIVKASVKSNPKPESKGYESFSRNTKMSLRDFNAHEARGWTIDRLQQIEDRINEKILEFFKPEKRELFKKIVLHSSVLNIGGKAKILRNIGIEPKIIEKIRRLSAIRNGFAHAAITGLITIAIKTDENGEKQTPDVKEHSMIEVMDSSGKLTTKNAMELLNEFLDIYKELKNEI